MIHLAEYRTHRSVAELQATEKAQISKYKLTGNVRKVYERIISSSFGNLGACKLKSQTIADDLGISRSTVTRCVKKLKDLHVIEVINDTKSNGIKGANIYAVIFSESNEPSIEPTKMRQRATNVNTVIPTDEQLKLQPESLSFNSFSNKNTFVVNNVNTRTSAQNVKEILKAIYAPLSIEGEKAFEELFKIAIGRLKQYMKSHNIPYLQMVDIITNCMRQLVAKQNVRNQFAMYSVMIKRQVEQLFEQPIQPKRAATGRTEMVPEWMSNPQTEQQNEQELQRQHDELMKRFGRKPSTYDGEVDFEAERAKVLAKLQGVV